MTVIKVEHLVKDYGNRRGCFDVSFNVNAGEVYGFLGPNGAGKTTTIRHMLGFLKPDKGSVSINGKTTWEYAHDINANIGYIPGEINFPDKITGMELIKWMADMRGTKDLKKAKELLDFFELDPDGETKRMSKGMKQKVGIVCALMHDSQILILDEPTSGLDPLMQEKFIELIRNEQKAGRTILMSSHMFPEVEKTCDRIGIIKQGEMVTEVTMNDITKSPNKTFKVKFADGGESKRIAKEHPELDFKEINHEKNRVKIKVNDKDINAVTRLLSNYKIQYMMEEKLTLEDYFMKFYSNEIQVKGGKKS